MRSGKGLWSALYAPAATPRDVLETLHKATVQALNSEPVQTAFKKQMIKAVPNASIDDAKAWNDGRDRALEEGHRRGEGRAAGLIAAGRPDASSPSVVRRESRGDPEPFPTARKSCRSGPRFRGQDERRERRMRGERIMKIGAGARRCRLQAADREGRRRADARRRAAQGRRVPAGRRRQIPGDPQSRSVPEGQALGAARHAGGEAQPAT